MQQVERKLFCKEMVLSFLKSINKEDFLLNYWEKKYLFLPNTFDGPKLSLTFEEILDLSLNEEIESRLITQNINNDWDVDYGPLENLKFQNKNKLWTLFIHNFNLCEQFSFELQKHVDFIPTWLFDDVLCSVSSDGSTVGAHFDRYNVFILQVSGKRKWKIQENPMREFRDDCSLKVLSQFEPDTEHVLGPGDMIFIPPGCAHEGTSIGESVSLSIGFKSLEDAALLESFFTETLSHSNPESYLPLDPSHFSKKSSEVNDKAIETLQKRILSQLQDPAIFKKTMMKFFTATKSEQFIENDYLNLDVFETKLKSSDWFFKDEIRFAKHKEKFWINQIPLNLDESTEKELEELIEKRFEDTSKEFSKTLIPALYELYTNDIIYFEYL